MTEHETYLKEQAAKKAAQAAAKKEIMAAARHLNSSRMAWVVCRYTSGTDWTGSRKGRMAEAMAGGYYHPGGQSDGLISSVKLNQLCSALRAEEAVDGTTTLRQQDVARVELRIAAQREIVSDWATEYARHRAVCRGELDGQRNYAAEYGTQRAERLISELEAAIARIEKISE